jgi:hypothetical protein
MFFLFAGSKEIKILVSRLYLMCIIERTFFFCPDAKENAIRLAPKLKN